MRVLRRQVRRNNAKADVNVTPFIDILLVLIVIFMVITPTAPTGLEGSVPQLPSQATTDRPNDQLVLSLADDGTLTLNHNPLHLSDIQATLQDLLRTRQDRTIFVRADEDVLFNEVVQVIDTAKGAGADRIGLLSLP